MSRDNVGECLDNGCRCPSPPRVPPTMQEREALADLCLSFLKPPKVSGSWTLNPTALADAIIAAGWRVS